MLKLTHPVLVIIRGVPGSGKTFFADSLKNVLPGANCIILDPDSTDYESAEYKKHVQQQNKDGVDSKLHPYRFLRAKAVEGFGENKIVIWNQPFTDLEIMKRVTDKLEEFAQEMKKKLPILVIEVEVPEKIAWNRVSSRKKLGGHGPNKEVFNKFFNDYKSSKVNGYNTISINGEKNPDYYTEIVINKIKQLSQ